MAPRKKTRARREPLARPTTRAMPLRTMTAEALDSYFATLNGHKPGQLYDLVLREVEEPLFKAVLEYADGNDSRAADILGINRGTLRKKVKTYGLSNYTCPHLVLFAARCSAFPTKTAWWSSRKHYNVAA